MFYLILKINAKLMLTFGDSNEKINNIIGGRKLLRIGMEAPCLCISLP